MMGWGATTSGALLLRKAKMPQYCMRTPTCPCHNSLSNLESLQTMHLLFAPLFFDHCWPCYIFFTFDFLFIFQTGCQVAVGLCDRRIPSRCAVRFGITPHVGTWLAPMLGEHKWLGERRITEEHYWVFREHMGVSWLPQERRVVGYHKGSSW